MAFWSLPRGGAGLSVPSGLTGSVPTMTTVTCGATPHTKTAWTQVVSNTGTAAWQGFWLTMPTNSSLNADSSALLDIGIGGSGSEVALVSNWSCGYHNSQSGHTPFFFPLRVPPASRLTIRLQSVIASKSIVGFSLFGNTGRNLLDNSMDIYGRCTTYGANTATSAGVTVTGSGSTNTLSSAVEISSSTTAPIHALMLGVQGAQSTSMATVNARAIVYVGGSGSEVAATGDIYFYSSSSTYYFKFESPNGICSPYTGLEIPAGSRLSMKIASASASKNADFVVLGFTR